MSPQLRRIITGVVLISLLTVLGISAIKLYGIQQRAMGGVYSDPPSVLKLTNNQLLPDSLRPLPVESLRFREDFSIAKFQQPPPDCRPWTKWWWPGTGLEASKLLRQLQQLDSIGFGGAEIQAFAAGVPQQDEKQSARLRNVHSSVYYGLLQTVLDQLGDSSGFQIDLNLNAGIGKGGPHINLNDNLQSLFWGETHVLGGKLINIDVPRAELPQAYYLAASIETEASGDLLGFHPDAMRLVCLLAGKVQSGKRSLNPLDLEAQLQLDPDSLFILTDFIGDDNHLRWQAPKGYWKIISVYAGPSGERPVYSATTEPGYLVNPLDSGRNVSHLNAVLKGKNAHLRVVGKALRGIASSPYHYQTERLFSDDLPAYFESKRGYPLHPYLPALMVPAGHNSLHEELRWPRKSWFQLTEEDERIRYDYQKTISELLLDRELASSQNWATNNGLHLRKQASGLAVDLIEAAGRADIPEAAQGYAGGSRLYLKLISSGAHLYDRPLLSAISFGHRDKQFQFSPQMFKAGADKLFLAGFNQLIYQGTPYPLPIGEGQFWHPFKQAQAPLAAQAADFGPASAFFPYWGTLNRYVSRCQYILRQGKPVSEALIFYPFLGFPASFSQAEGYQEWYFNGDLPPWSENSPRRPAFKAFGQKGVAPIPQLDWYRKVDEMLKMLENQGINWDWANNRALQAARWEDGYWQIGSQRYSYLIVANAPYIEWETARHLDSLANLGAPLVIYGTPPLQQPGFHQYQEADQAIEQIMLRHQAGRDLANPADLRNHLQRLRVERPLRYAGSYPFLRHQLRRLNDQQYLGFLVNQSEEERYFRLQLPSRIRYAYWLDPQDGKVYEADYQVEQDLLAFLPAYGSLFLYLSDTPLSENDSISPGSPLPYFLAQSSRTILHELQNWQMLVSDIPGMKNQRFERKDSVFFDWRAHPKLRFTAEEGRYLAEFFLQDTLADIRYVLDFGELYQTADVYLNTQLLGRLSYTPYLLECTHKLNPGWNALEIWVKPSHQNAMIRKGQKGDPVYQQLADDYQLQAAGLLGPVRLLEVLPEGQIPTPVLP